MLIAYLELYLFFFFPGGQLPDPFCAAYENMKSVLDGLFQSILFTLFQLYLTTEALTLNNDTALLILSTVISITRGTRTFMYLETLSVAYQQSKFSLLIGLIDVGASLKWPKWLQYSKLNL